MRQWMVGTRGRLATVVVALVCALSSASGETSAEEDLSATDDGALSSEELQALVAPVALYPDLVLVLALQASLEPLDIVQADRFLTQYAEDPSLLPDQGWDESVVGLLNYPTVVRTMSADLDWTDTLGTAVITQLEGVQDAIQDFRAFMHAIGALKSNEQMTIIAEGDIIRIEPTDENAVFIPQYDPDALLAALYSTDVGLEAAAPEDEAITSEEVAGSEGVAGTEEFVESEGEFVAEEGAYVEAAPVQEAAPVTEVVPAAAPAYYPAVAPPPVTYSEPAPSWLGTAATFAGGAAVGGLVGWAIADDDDDDNDNDGNGDYSRGNIDIEDSEITINRGGDGDDLEDLQRQVQDERGDRQDLQQAQREQTKLKVENERLKREASEKAQREQAKGELEQRHAERQPSAAQAGGERKVAGLSTSGSKEAPVAKRSAAGEKQLAARTDQAKSRAAPKREAGRAAPATSSKTARAGDSKRPQAASAFGGSTKSASEVRRESDRGLTSRSRAKAEVEPSRGRGGSSAFAQSGDSSGSRGRQSRGRR